MKPNVFIARYMRTLSYRDDVEYKKEIFFAESREEVIERLKKRAQIWQEKYLNVSITNA